MTKKRNGMKNSVPPACLYTIITSLKKPRFSARVADYGHTNHVYLDLQIAPDKILILNTQADF